MFIQTEETPNPLSLKFIPGRRVVEGEGVSFVRPEDAASSRLARALFAVTGVASVYFGADFVTVTKTEEAVWATLKPLILTAIMEHFLTGLPAVEEATATVHKDDNPLVAQIRELIDTKVRPAVAMDGGDIVFDRFEDGIVYLYMRGACAGCPSSTATLKSGIENMLRHYVPEVVEVRAVE